MKKFFLLVTPGHPNFVWVAVLVIFLTGCGYTTHSLLPSHIKTIYIKPFENNIDITGEVSDRHLYHSYRPLLEIDLTNEIIDRFIYDGALKVVRHPDADIILAGEVIDYLREPLRYSENDEVEEYRLSLVANMKLRDLRSDELLWEERRFIGDTTYFTRGSLSKSEDVALDDAIKDLARRIVERTVEGW